MKVALPVVLLALTFAFATNALADASERPNVLAVEALGRGLAYSVSYDREISERWTAGLGFTAWSGTTNSPTVGPDTDFTFIGVPAYVNWYFRPTGRNRIYVTLGAAYGYVTGNDPNTGLAGSGNGFYSPLGVGYEHRTPKGLVLRAAPYLIVSKDTSLWLGFTVGYAGGS